MELSGTSQEGMSIGRLVCLGLSLRVVDYSDWPACTNRVKVSLKIFRVPYNSFSVKGYKIALKNMAWQIMKR